MCPSGVEELSLYSHNETLQSHENTALSKRSRTQKNAHYVTHYTLLRKRAGKSAGLGPTFRAEDGILTGRECEEDSGVLVYAVFWTCFMVTWAYLVARW